MTATNVVVVVAAPLLTAERPMDISASGSSPLAVSPSSARRLNVAPDALGESPVWDHRTRTLHWLDLVEGTLSSLSFGAAAALEVPVLDSASSNASQVAQQWLSRSRPRLSRVAFPEDALGFVVPTTSPWVLCFGSSNGLSLFDLRRGAVFERGPNPERALPRNRFNDGKTGPDSRLYAGTLQRKMVAGDIRETGSARLYSFDSFYAAQGGRPVNAVGRVTVSNGLDWSPAGDQFYYVDTPTMKVVKFDFEASTGTPSNPRVLRDYGDGAGGRPDGLCVDSDGHVWVATLEAGRVERLHHTTGEVLAKVVCPGVKLVTSVCFGGPSLSLLFITTSSGTTSDAAAKTRAADPSGPSGQLFVAFVDGVRGKPMVPFPIAKPPGQAKI